jgi:hypothetical protein
MLYICYKYICVDFWFGLGTTRVAGIVRIAIETFLEEPPVFPQCLSRITNCASWEHAAMADAAKLSSGG